MTEHHAISRRAFTLGLGLAALSPFVSLPETAMLGISPRTAFADGTAESAATLDKFVIRLRPAGYFRTASVNEDGNVIGNVCHLFNDGTSSKLILEHVGTDADGTNWYAIRTLLNFEEHKKTGYSIWSVDGDSDKDGKVIHVWSGEYDHKDSRAYTFDRQFDGTYIIRDRIYTNNGINYLAIESKGKDQDNNKICQKKYSIPWELELVGYSMDKTNATVSSIDWTTYSSYVDGPCWMSHVEGNKYLDELSIPGTHDSGTCSVDNDTEPQSSQAKCQQDYIPTQLLEGIRYFDIRLGKGDDPGIDHGDYYLLKKDAYFMHLSDVIGYFKTFFERKSVRSAHHACIPRQQRGYWREPYDGFRQGFGRQPQTVLYVEPRAHTERGARKDRPAAPIWTRRRQPKRPHVGPRPSRMGQHNRSTPQQLLYVSRPKRARL